MQYLFGLMDLGLMGHIIVGVVLIQTTITAVTLYLHRDQTHRGVDLHPALRHFFRFWLWLTTGMGTRDWVAVHRKHHARCETEDDPHSPQVLGLSKVLFQGAELYKEEAARPETLEKYGRGCPDDWMERNVYSRYTYLGLVIMGLTDFLLFGVGGITIFAFQIGSIPLFAAGVINGIGHYWGYRNFECPDAATNIVPWAIFLGGEELHNNHHAFPSSARFSIRPYEFDIGWMWLRLFSALGLADIRRVAPEPVELPEPRPTADLDNVRAVIINRMHVLRSFARDVTVPVLRQEAATADDSRWQKMLRRARKLMIREERLLDEGSREQLELVLSNNESLRMVHEYRERLQALWEGAAVSNDRLVKHFRDWLAEAEASGIQALEDFARRLRAYSMPGSATTA